ncbi:hypothetical protein BX616_011039 [Lobosporangium transversale]|uniref:Endoplasmic reticulum-based factor for assembly of V-ATPase-domain-containing protein n=1 Tax=Lobosporangium transversale TaxID=64571 RepID=A0A1Y2H121_9FUNG|nr:endoplasmic reticulum-based factor for assembly of V-ATPase-domain-containing protein [Lobosporangium transversale]KAF9909839.1 hypothetical protein BX616_011039 [Lobosporangium transversale]ORZ28257.1 endoplasmic reticulum-based factor for assembly of V-ATPase-domain-containing protein [Lobosporangium transversale]|eukprot:XP_021885942.1 endoplasmic reticulum-based factor for assembly of V-ATPase-domain-containing protein [Lobosporangium transversale]
MVNLEWTPRLDKAFTKLYTKTKSAAAVIEERESGITLNSAELKTVKAVESILDNAKTQSPLYVDLELVRRVSALLLKYRDNDTDTEKEASEDWIHTMIKGSSIYVPKAAPRERTPELERLMDTFRAQAAEKEYQRMISCVDPTSSTSIANNIRQDIKDMKDIKAHAIGIVNVLYTGAAVFTAVFMISAHFTEDLGMRVLLAFAAFILIVACEAYLYSRHASSAVGGANRRKKAPKLPEDVVITTHTFSKEKSA